MSSEYTLETLRPIPSGSSLPYRLHSLLASPHHADAAARHLGVSLAEALAALTVLRAEGLVRVGPRGAGRVWTQTNGVSDDR